MKTKKFFQAFIEAEIFSLKIKLLLFLFSILLFLFSSTQVSAEKKVEITAPAIQVQAKKLDTKAEILAAYLETFNSPLQYHAQDFIDAANIYELDWKLLPAIAGVESTFGKHIPGGFNAWGWGVYGTQAIYFDSWKDGIFTVTQGLRENYLNKGLNNPYSINRVYAASPYWGSRVTYFMQDLEKFADIFETETHQAKDVATAPEIAAVSGQLVLR